MVSAGETKQGLLQRLRQHYSVESAGGPNLLKVNCHAILYVRSSKNLSSKETGEGRFWFGVTASEYERPEKGTLFIVCCCQVSDLLVDYVAIPDEEFEKLKVLIPMQSGQYKFTLVKNRVGQYHLIAPGIEPCDVTEFSNCLDFTPGQFRQPEKRQLSVVPKIGSPVDDSEKVDTLDNLPQALRDASVDSQNPGRFESLLQNAFSALGFTCRRIGGSGDTDILITEPVRIIVDAKSTAQRSKNSLNFTRIKRHMSENKASRMLVVSVSFDPAVIRDALLEGGTLVPIDTLVHLLDRHRELVFAPDDIAEIMFKPGLADLARLNELVEQDSSSEDLRVIDLLLQVLDYQPVSVDVLRGRLDSMVTNRGLARIETDQLIKALGILSSSLVVVVERVGDLYRRRYPPHLAIKRLAMVNSKLHDLHSKQLNT